MFFVEGSYNCIYKYKEDLTMNDSGFKEKEYYREKIVEMVNKIENPAIIESIYSFAAGILSVKEKQEAD